MVRYTQIKEDCDLSNIHTICSNTEFYHSQTLISIIDNVPKLTPQERNQTSRCHHSTTNNCKKWSQAQTKQFYELLQHFGLDFTLMSHHPYFSRRRSQKQLSNKYKKQLKLNSYNMNKVLNKIDRDGLYGICKTECGK